MYIPRRFPIYLNSHGAIEFHRDIMTGQNLRHLGVFDMLAFENRRKYGESFQLSRAVKYERGYCSFFAEPVLAGVGIMPPP